MISKNTPVIILGIHDGHNAGVALIKDGEVIAAINEERLNNIKNYSGLNPDLKHLRRQNRHY